MIIYMSDILCVTNRKLCKEDFLTHIEKIAKENPHGIILREKDLTSDEYLKLARSVMEICKKYNTQCILHSFVDVSKVLNHPAIHLPLPILRKLTEGDKTSFTTIGASCHSLEEAKEAEALGCTYITVGHIFETDCKKGLAGRGLSFLHTICENVTIPVYAIGGIDATNIGSVRMAGASGACIMSSLMNCDDPKQYLHMLDRRNDNENRIIHRRQ